MKFCDMPAFQSPARTDLYATASALSASDRSTDAVLVASDMGCVGGWARRPASGVHWARPRAARARASTVAGDRLDSRRRSPRRGAEPARAPCGTTQTRTRQRRAVRMRFPAREPHRRGGAAHGCRVGCRARRGDRGRRARCGLGAPPPQWLDSTHHPPYSMGSGAAPSRVVRSTWAKTLRTRGILVSVVGLGIAAGVSRYMREIRARRTFSGCLLKPVGSANDICSLGG
jgi:hypothetical protein